MRQKGNTHFHSWYVLFIPRKAEKLPALGVGSKDIKARLDGSEVLTIAEAIEVAQGRKGRAVAFPKEERDLGPGQKVRWGASAGRRSAVRLSLEMKME